jgi:hypothetical protein
MARAFKSIWNWRGFSRPPRSPRRHDGDLDAEGGAIEGRLAIPSTACFFQALIMV